MFFCFFFFQAEDGIRDWSVTGVQTCALPIYAFFTGAGYFVQSKVVTTIAEDQAPGMSQMILSFGLFTFGLTLVAVAYLVWRSEERRVGKECRSRWSACR